MSFVIAIIGRYGVGKRLVSRYATQLGVQKIDLELVLKAFIPEDSDWALCLKQQYDQLSQPISEMRDPVLQKSIIEYVQSEKKKAPASVVVLPSFLDVAQLIRTGVFEHVLAVDCAESCQKQYLEQLGVSNKASDILIQSGHPRKYYTDLGKDIFLNSVSLAHMEWVVGKLIRTYQLIHDYK